MMVLRSHFVWQDAPLSDWRSPAFAVVLYLVIVPVLRAIMKNREGLQLKTVTVCHNLVLTVASLVMFIGTAFELYSRYETSGYTFDWFFCETQTATHGALYLWSYIYYLSKYYEMLDTILVILQKSRVPHFGLQVYHHAVVLPMAYMWCEYQQSLHWGGLLFNTMVHVVMYSYYACKGMGIPTPWKSWITKLQITQFATSFLLGLKTCTMVWQGHQCGGLAALLFNVVFNVSLLYQFVGVDQRNKRLQTGNGEVNNSPKKSK